MFKFFQKKPQDDMKKISKLIDQFNEQLRMIRVLLYADLRTLYFEELDKELASTLAAQVVNYL